MWNLVVAIFIWMFWIAIAIGVVQLIIYGGILLIGGIVTFIASLFRRHP